MDMGKSFIKIRSGLTNRSIIFAGALGESLHDASGHNPVGVGNGVGEVIRGKAGLKLLAAGALTGQAESLSHFAPKD